MLYEEVEKISLASIHEFVAHNLLEIEEFHQDRQEISAQHGE